MLKLRDMRAAMTVAEVGSVSRAADTLHLSQPAVTHAIKRVEDELGYELFNRSYVGMRATDVGEIFVRRAAKVFQHLNIENDEYALATGLRRVSTSAWAAFERAVNRSHLRMLIDLNQCRNIDCTAQRMGVSKTLIYRLLRDIEGILNAEVFRRGDSFVPTLIGDVLCQRANLVFAELRALDEEIAKFRGRLQGRIVVGTLPSARIILVPKAIAHLSRQYPEIRVSMIEKPYSEMLTELSSGNIDIIVGSIRKPPFDLNLDQHLLFEDPVAVLARTGHPLLNKPQVTLEDLSKHRWVLPPKGVPTRTYFDSLFKRHGLQTPEDIVETDSMVALRSLMIEDDRLAMTSPYRAMTELETGVLQVMPFRINDISLFFGYLVRSQAEMPPCLSAFVQTLRGLSAAEVARRAVQAYAS